MYVPYMPDEIDRIKKGGPEQVDYPATIAIVSVNSADFNPPVPYSLTFHPPPQGDLLAFLFTHLLFCWISLVYGQLDSKNV
jgi:hypothetical protein